MNYLMDNPGILFLLNLFLLIDGLILWKNKKKLVPPFILGWTVCRLFEWLKITNLIKRKSPKSTQKSIETLLDFLINDVIFWIVSWAEVLVGGLVVMTFVLYYVLLIMYF